MSLVQRMNGNNKTFAQLAESALYLVLNEGAQSQNIDIVFDTSNTIVIHQSKML